MAANLCERLTQPTTIQIVDVNFIRQPLTARQYGYLYRFPAQTTAAEIFGNE